MGGDSSAGRSSGISSLDLLRRDLDRKANKEWVQSEVEHLEKDVEEAKSIALSAKKKAETPHLCTQEPTIKEIVRSINRWRGVKIGAVIGGAATVIVAAAFLVRLQGSVENNQTAISRVQTEVTKSTEATASEIQSVKKAVEVSKAQREKSQEDQIRAIKEAVKEAVSVQADIRPRGRTR